MAGGVNASHRRVPGLIRSGSSTGQSWRWASTHGPSPGAYCSCSMRSLIWLVVHSKPWGPPPISARCRRRSWRSRRRPGIAVWCRSRRPHGRQAGRGAVLGVRRPLCAHRPRRLATFAIRSTPARRRSRPGFSGRRRSRQRERRWPGAVPDGPGRPWARSTAGTATQEPSARLVGLPPSSALGPRRSCNPQISMRRRIKGGADRTLNVPERRRRYSRARTMVPSVDAPMNWSSLRSMTIAVASRAVARASARDRAPSVEISCYSVSHTTPVTRPYLASPPHPGQGRWCGGGWW